MKVWIFSLRTPSGNRPAGGAQRYALDFACSLREHGHCVRIVGAFEAGKPSREILEGIEVQRLSRYWIFPWLGLWWNLIRKAPEAHLVVENMMSFLALMPGAFTRTPAVSIKHHFGTHQRSAAGGRAFRDRALWWIEHRQIPRAYSRSRLIFPSQRTEAHFKSLCPRFRGRAAICPPAVQMAPNQASFLGSPTILYVGVVNLARKRVDHLLEASMPLLAELPDLRVEIAGEGPDRRRLQERYAHERVAFLGYVSEAEKWQALARAWVFASPSTAEGFGISWVEANSAGLPVVAYDLGLDTVAAGCGTFVPVGDVPRLREALKGWLDPNRLREMRPRAVRSAQPYARMPSEEALRSLGIDVDGSGTTNGRTATRLVVPTSDSPT
ncbi:MAG: glycosyltransferase family 4 protein [Gammaproteobacteria bacterium]|nr:glycosyltransferase family 4 protein [Gammaproteobacteria bacterium]